MDEKQIKGTQTEKNLLKAYAGESQARGRYKMFAEVARQEGYEQIAAIFMETAHQEYVHARNFFSFLEGGSVEISASYPTGPVGDTERNLQEAAAGEHEEWAELYNEFSRVAKEEGFSRIATLFRLVAEVEQGHEQRYMKLLDRVKAGTVFTDEEEQNWQCRECGYVHRGKTAPAICPTCGKGQGYFEREKENY